MEILSSKNEITLSNYQIYDFLLRERFKLLTHNIRQPKCTSVLIFMGVRRGCMGTPS